MQFVSRGVKKITLEGLAQGDVNPMVHLLTRSGGNIDAAFVFLRSANVKIVGIDTVGFGLYFEQTVRLSLMRITVWNVIHGDRVVLNGVRRSLLQNVSVHNSTGRRLRP